MRLTALELERFSQKDQVVSREIWKHGAGEPQRAVGSKGEGKESGPTERFGEEGQIECSIVGNDYRFFTEHL